MPALHLLLPALCFLGLAPHLAPRPERIARLTKAPRAAALSEETPTHGHLGGPSVGEAGTTPAYLMVIEASRAGQWEHALSLLERARAEHEGWLLARSLHAASLACSRAGQWERALELLDELEAAGRKPRIDAYNAVIRAAGREGELGAALRTLERMREVGVEPDAVSYACAIAALKDAGDAAACVSMIQSMRDRGVAPELPAISCSVAACRAAAKGRMAARVIRDALAAGLVPGEADFVSAMSACLAEGALNEGTSLWNRMLALRADDALPPLGAKAYTAAMSLKALRGNIQAVKDLLGKMEHEGLVPDLVAFNTALRACAKAADSDAAEALLARMRANGLVPDGYTYSALIAANVNNLERALELLVEAEAASDAASTSSPAPAVYGAALAAAAKAGAGREAASILERMRTRGVQPDLGCCGGALHAFQAAGMWREVYDLLYSMRSEGLISPATMRRSHRALFQRAKRELGIGTAAA